MHRPTPESFIKNKDSEHETVLDQPESLSQRPIPHAFQTISPPIR